MITKMIACITLSNDNQKSLYFHMIANLVIPVPPHGVYTQGGVGGKTSVCFSNTGFEKKNG